MSGILLHLHFKPDKIIFWVTFFLEGNFKLNIFPLVISLSLSRPTSLSDCKSPDSRSELLSRVAVVLPLVCGGSALHCQPRTLVTDTRPQASENIFIVHISKVGSGFFFQMLSWRLPVMAQKKPRLWYMFLLRFRAASFTSGPHSWFPLSACTKRR